MGWKLFSIVVSPAPDIRDHELLEKLGFSSFEKTEDEPYECALYPDDGLLYIGRHKGSLIISSLTLPEHFLSDKLSDTEKSLIELAPDAEIGAFVLHSGMNYWGYAIIKNGQKIRVKSGDSDNGVAIDIGEPLEQELDLLSKSKIGADGQRLYYFEDFDDPLTEDQVGENFVFEMYRRYFNEQLDCDDELMAANCSGYSIKKQKANTPKSDNADSAPSKPWWKIW